MAKKVKRLVKYRRGTKSKNKLNRHKQQASEKIFLLAAICLAIISIILLFNPSATTFVTLDSGLSKTNYDPGESLFGQLELVMQENDILGKDATLISLDVFNKDGEPRCPEVYICYNEDVIEWQYYNITKNECRDIEYASGNTGDPAEECCYRNQANCLGLNEALDNADFEDQLLEWQRYATLGGVVTADYNIKHNGDYSGKTDTGSAYATGTQESKARLYQTFPGIPIRYFGSYTPSQRAYPIYSGITGRAINSFEDSLKFFVRYDVPENVVGVINQGYYFEIILTGKTPDYPPKTYNLHYWFNVGKMPPASGVYDKYVVVATSGTFNEGIWKEFTLNIYDDWRDKGLPSTAKLEKIQLRSAGKKVVIEEPEQIITGRAIQQTTTIYGQQVNWDDVLLQYNVEASTQCLDYGKKCCLEDRGVGNYFGEQLDCSVGKCWDACTELELFTFEEFISYSTSPSKGNWTSGAYKSGIRILGGSGEGYGYCFETTDEDNSDCFGWDNKYKVKLGNDSEEDEFEFNAPEYEGEYELVINVTFTNHQGTTLKLDSSKENFFVGEGQVTPDCPDSNYTWTNTTVWSDWSSCINGTQEKTRELEGAYTGTEDCPSTKTKTETDEQSCGCIPDWNCEWQYCTIGEQQEKICIDLNDCEDSYVDETRNCCIEDWKCGSWSSCQFGEQTRTCYDDNVCETTFNEPETIRNCEKPFFVALWWLWLIILLAVVIVVVFATKIIPLPRLKGRKKAKSGLATITEYTELTSYINQALGYGATKQEIRQKLQDAGWPSSAVDKAFKATGK